MSSPRLRFCMVSTFYPPYHFGGDAIVVRNLAQALVRRGHRVDVIHDVDAFNMLHDGPAPELESDVGLQAAPRPDEQPDGVRTHPLRSRFGRLSCLATQQTGRPIIHGRRIARILATGNFDVINFHNISLVGGPGILAYGNAIKLYMAHEHWLVCPSHVLWRHNRELCTGRQCLRCVLHFGRPPQLWRYSGLLEKKASHVDAFIVPSTFSANKHKEFGFPFEFEVLPNFVPDPDTAGRPTGERGGDAHERPYFLFVGRLEKIKGLQDLLPHFGEDAPADLRVVGSGDYESTLRRQAVSLPRVRFLGRRTSEDLRKLYQNALAVVVPSVCYETFGNVLIESFRERTPAIARALGPFIETIEKSGGGLLFENSAQLADALRRMSSDPALRAKLGEAGYQAVLERWTERVVMQQYFDLIRRIAHRHGNARVLDALEEQPGESHGSTYT